MLLCFDKLSNRSEKIFLVAEPAEATTPNRISYNIFNHFRFFIIFTRHFGLSSLCSEKLESHWQQSVLLRSRCCFWISPGQFTFGSAGWLKYSSCLPFWLSTPPSLPFCWLSRCFSAGSTARWSARWEYSRTAFPTSVQEGKARKQGSHIQRKSNGCATEYWCCL